jgi:hypothetical protein
MAQNYYTLAQAAEILGKAPEELNQMVRRGELRAFADGGSWKFRTQDIDERRRTDELLSEVEISVEEDDLTHLFMDVPDNMEKSPSDSDVGRQLQREPQLKDSGESDVRVIFSGDKDGSDSDIKLVPDFGQDEPTLNDDDLFLADDSAEIKPPTDSGIRLAPETTAEETGQDDDSTMISADDSSIGLAALSDPEPETAPPALSPEPTLADNSGMFLTPESDSGVSMKAEDIDIEDLAIAGDSGVMTPIDEMPTVEMKPASDSDIRLTRPTSEPASTIDAPVDSEDDLDLFDSDDDMILEDAPTAKSTAPTRDDDFSFDDDELGVGFDLKDGGNIDLADIGLTDKTPTVQQAAGDDSDSDFDLNLDEDIGLAQDVVPTSGDSGINISKPDDSGILLSKAADSGIRLQADDTDSSDSEFDVSLESDDDIFDSEDMPAFKASDTAPRMSKVQEEDSSDETSDSEFELALDSDGDLDDESGSEVVAVDDDEEEPSDEFEGGDEVDDDERAYDSGIAPVVGQPAPWGGIWVSIMFLTSMVFAVVMVMMYEMTRNAWSYNEPTALNATVIEAIHGLGKSIGLMP